MKRKLALILSLVLVLTLVMTGCGKGEEPKPANGGDKKTEEKAGDANNPAKGRENAKDTLVIGMSEAKGDFMPVYFSTTYDKYVVSLAYDGLIENDEEGNPTPLVAKELPEISEDKKTYTFHLRDDVKFADGEPLTAEDVEFTYLAMADPSYDGRYISTIAEFEGYEDYKDGKTDKMSGIKVIDEHTIEFTFKEALSTHIWSTDFGIMPKHVFEFEKGDTKALKAKMQEMSGSGPYILEKFEPKQYIEFKANENYFLGKPKVDKIILKFTTPETMLSELEKGTIDVQLSVPPNGENKEIVDGTGFLNIVEYPDNTYGYMGLNHRDERLADKKVRQALSYGFNRKQFVDVYYQGHANVCNSPISQVSWAFSDDVEKYEYDPDKAMKLLDEAGWKVGKDGIREKDGKKLDFVWDTYVDSKYVETMIPMLKDDWEKIGIKVEANLMEFNALVEKIYEKREFDMYNMSWSMTPDPDSYGEFHSDNDIPSANNSIGFRDEKNDKLIEDARKEFDKEKRTDIYNEWAKYLSEELPYMFLTQPMRWDSVNKRVKNFNTKPLKDFYYRDVLLNIEIE